MIIFYFFLFQVFTANDTLPLGCTEDENSLLLIWPFFTVPVGKKAEIKTVCDFRPSIPGEITEKIRPLNNAVTEKRENFIVIKKKKAGIKKFYSTENLSAYPGIFIDKKLLSLQNSVILHLKRISGDGLFLLVLRDKERLFARQIIIEEKGRCPIRVSLPIEEFFEIPYKRGDFMEGIYNIELYMMNYNKMEWTIEGFEIK